MSLTPAHLLANLKYPRFRGESLQNVDVTQAQEYVSEHFPNFMPCLMKFMGKSDPFKQYHLAEKVITDLSPLAWWQSFAGKLIKMQLTQHNSCILLLPLLQVLSESFQHLVLSIQMCEMLLELKMQESW